MSVSCWYHILKCQYFLFFFTFFHFTSLEIEYIWVWTELKISPGTSVMTIFHLFIAKTINQENNSMSMGECVLHWKVFIQSSSLFVQKGPERN